MMVTVTCVQPNHIPLMWDAVEPGLADAMERSHGEMPVEVLQRNLMNANFYLWIALEDNEFAGFTITEFLPTANGTWLNVLYTWARPGSDVIDAGLGAVETFARSLGLRGVKFLSSRPGFRRRAKTLGFTPRLQEYVKEFEK